MNRIDKRRFPDIECDGETHSYNGVKTPLEQVLEVTTKSIYLVGNGGQGKSTTLFSYWLDHMTDGNCIYVDMRCIKSEEGKETCAISDYIFAKYHLALNNLSNDMLMLLDGVNEAPIDLRRFNGSGCDLLTEIIGIREKFRVVISSRNQTITVYPREYIPQREFSDEKICYCELLPLAQDQVLEVIKKNISYTLNPALLKLLGNNAMFSMFNDAQLMGIEIFSQNEEICAGVLLDRYFDRYLRLKFIQLTASTSKSLAEILELIKNGDWDIDEANKKWEELCWEFTELAFKNIISKEKLAGYNGYALFRLGILREVENGYEWGDELYRIYFFVKQYLKIFYQIDCTQEQKEASIVNLYHIYQNAKDINLDYYEILRYTGEIITRDLILWERIINIKTENLKYFNILNAMVCLNNEYTEKPKDVMVILNKDFDILDSLLDNEDHTPIALKSLELGITILYDQIAIIPLGEEDSAELYVILKPITRVPGIPENAAVVFKAEEHKGGETVLSVVEDSATALQVFSNYYDLCDEAGMEIDYSLLNNTNYENQVFWNGIKFLSFDEVEETQKQIFDNITDSNLIAKILDANDFSDIRLWNEQVGSILFEQIAVVDIGLNNRMVCLLRPKIKLQNIGEQEGILFTLKDKEMPCKIKINSKEGNVLVTSLEVSATVLLEQYLPTLEFLGAGYTPIKISPKYKNIL